MYSKYPPNTSHPPPPSPPSFVPLWSRAPYRHSQSLLVSPPQLIVPWPSPASVTPVHSTSRDPLELSRDYYLLTRDQSHHDHTPRINETNDKKVISLLSEKETNEPKMSSPQSKESPMKTKKDCKKRWSHRPKLHPPSRPEVVINRSKRDPLTGRRYPYLTVLCYNVLSQDLILENPYLYTSERPEWLDWEYRKRRLLKELVHSETDIMCLQEVSEEHYSNWYQRQLLSYGYKGVYLKRTGTSTDGCAIFYYTRAVELIEVNYVPYQKNKGTLDRNNVGLIAKFKLLTSSSSTAGKEFLIATTHLLFNPKAGEVKLAQISYLLAELHKMASSSSSSSLLPCILCGDFNSLPNSPLLRFLLEGTLNYTHLSATSIAGYNQYVSSSSKYRHIPYPILPEELRINTNCQYVTTDSVSIEDTPASSELDIPPKTKKSRVSAPIPDRLPAIVTHPFTFVSSYPMPLPGTTAPTVTTYHHSAAETVDYILYTPPSKGVGFHAVRRDALPSFSTLETLGPQPNQVLSSDHLYLCVELQLVS